MNKAQNQRAFLGTGLHFPIAVDGVTGRIRESSYEENIKESIWLIVMTKKGERLMRPDFGCDIHQFMFDTVDYTVLTQMRHAVESALVRWEPRIVDIEADVQKIEEGTLKISVSYRVRMTNNPFNLVFPFYLEEA